MKKKDKKAGKSKKEIEAEEAEREAEKAQDMQEAEENKVEEPPITYLVGDMYEAQWEALQKRDYEIEQLLAKAKVKALKQNDLRVYDDLELKKLTRKQMRAYLNADKAKERPEIDMEEINKDWQGKDLDNKAYGEFWKPIDRADLPRGS